MDKPTSMTEQEIILRCQQREANAFRQLYQSYQQRVRSTLYQLCGNEMLDDLVQEVFLRVWQGLPKLRQTDYFATWLYRITWNVATDKRRQFAKGKNWTETPESLAQELSRPQDSPDLMQLHYQELVKQALATLSLDHRAVLVLHDLEDLPQKEVAEILKLPLGTVKSRLFYARASIRTFLQEQGAL